jgi:rSAM-partnered protein
MVGKPERYRVGEHSRNAVEHEWEIFTREDESDSLTHIGSISAPSADVAYQQATKLFAWYASDIWVCPARAVYRYTTHELDDQAEPVTIGSGEEDRTHEL